MPLVDQLQRDLVPLVLTKDRVVLPARRVRRPGNLVESDAVALFVVAFEVLV
jgi:hypothetical protein